mmetsp:Transcript_26452/g.55595  ORF Transcript_26452/g.55595 Transcript_26452/m.55595 type:complete len:367 (-) Transcript_26452:360-1460(-)
MTSCASPMLLPPLPPLPLPMDPLWSELPNCDASEFAVQLQSDQMFWELHEDLQPLGKGYYGRVRLVRILSSGELAAVKLVEKASGWRHDSDWRKEPEMLRTLMHPNIIQLIATYQTPCSMFIVMLPELGGDLHSLARSLPGNVFPESEAKRYASSLLQAVQHIHDRGIVHRDIKPSNVLLSVGGVLKLADFGLCEQLPDSGMLTNVCGTHDFLAPEMIRCGHGEEAGYGLAVDLWGVGLLLYVLLFGHNPFEHRTEIETLQAILRADYSFPEHSSVSSAAKSLISKLLVADPRQRLSASECLLHEWLCEPDGSVSCTSLSPPPSEPSADASAGFATAVQSLASSSRSRTGLAAFRIRDLLTAILVL